MKSNQANKKIQTQSKSTQNIKNKTVKTFDSYIKNKSLYLLFIPVALLILFVYKDFITLHNLFLFKDIGADTVTSFYPNYVCLSNYIREIGIPSWSFQQGLGQNLFPFNMGDPFSFILYLSGESLIPYMIVYIEITKIILISIFSYLLFRKLDLSSYTCIIGSLMLSFSGYAILGGTWYIFSTEALYFILILYGFECLFKGDNWYVFLISIFLISSYQPVILFVSICFVSIYAITRIAMTDDFSVSKLLKLTAKTVGVTILGVGLSGIFLLPTVNQLLHSPRGSGDFSMFKTLISFGLGVEKIGHYGTAIMRFFSNNMLGTGNNFSGWGNYLEAPILYCGLPVILLIPQIFIGVSRKMKIIYACLVSAILIILIFPFFRYAFWGFSGDYYRLFSFGIVSLLVFISLNSLHNIVKNGKVNLVLLGITIVCILVILNAGSRLEVSPDSTIRKISMFLIILYGLLILMLKYEKTRLTAQIFLLITLVFELGYTANETVNNRKREVPISLALKTDYNDFTKEALDYIKKEEKSFYRINKTYFSATSQDYSAFNDSKMQHYNGSTSYTSFNQLQYIKFFQETNVINKKVESDSRWCIGYMNHPLLQAICNVKYTLSKGPVDPAIVALYDSVATIGNIQIRKSRNYLPLGVTYDTYMNYSEYNKLQAIGKQIALFKAFIVDSASNIDTTGFKVFTVKDMPPQFSMIELNQDVNKLKADSLRITSFIDWQIKGDINMSARKLLFLAIPNDEGWQLIVDGKPRKISTVTAGMMGVVLDKGQHNIILEYYRPYMKLGVIITLISFCIFLVILLAITLKKRRIQGSADC